MLFIDLARKSFIPEPRALKISCGFWFKKLPVTKKTGLSFSATACNCVYQPTWL
jgi:hypothetical protein